MFLVFLTDAQCSILPSLSDRCPLPQSFCWSWMVSQNTTMLEYVKVSPRHISAVLVSAICKILKLPDCDNDTEKLRLRQEAWNNMWKSELGWFDEWAASALWYCRKVEDLIYTKKPKKICLLIQWSWDTKCQIYIAPWKLKVGIILNLISLDICCDFAACRKFHCYDWNAITLDVIWTIYIFFFFFHECMLMKYIL